jgi:hypothetical protein
MQARLADWVVCWYVSRWLVSAVSGNRKGLVAPRADRRGDSVVEIGDAIGRLDHAHIVEVQNHWSGAVGRIG